MYFYCSVILRIFKVGRHFIKERFGSNACNLEHSIHQLAIPKLPVSILEFDNRSFSLDNVSKEDVIAAKCSWFLFHYFDFVILKSWTVFANTSSIFSSSIRCMRGLIPSADWTKELSSASSWLISWVFAFASSRRF